MKQTRPPKPVRPLKTPPVSGNRPGGEPLKTGQANPRPDLPEAKGWAVFTTPLKILGGLVLAGLVIVAAVVFLPPQPKPEKSELNSAVNTALASTGFTPRATPKPGSDFGVDLVIYGIRDYVPALDNEKVTFLIINTRQRSLYLSNCDGTQLQRFLGTNVKDKTQFSNLDNWETIAPGGFRNCGPASEGGMAIRIAPSVRADASFDFKQTRPYAGKTWDKPGWYRLFLTYYLTCPSNSDRIKDCLDRGTASSDAFQIVDPNTLTVVTPPPASPSVGSPLPTITIVVPPTVAITPKP